MLFDTSYRQFLLELDKQKTKTKYARITVLTLDERPIEMIEGRVTQGSVNIDGNSAVRRTCSLTMVTNEFNYNEAIWIEKAKFKLEIGLKNDLDTRYPDTIWFKQGIYVITQFNASRSTNNFQISIQGQDKMCLLNGFIGGSLTASYDFGTMEAWNPTVEQMKTEKIPIPDIIRNIVSQLGGEPLHNIIINGLEQKGLELLESRYPKDIYLYRESDSSVWTNIILNENKDCWVNGSLTSTKLGELTSAELDLVEPITGETNTPAYITFDENRDEIYHVAKVSYGQTVGYRTTPLVYPKDLIANIGEAITSILDKIKNLLGEFEYFYDIDGRFIFQKKQSFINTLWSPAQTNENNETYVESLALASASAYTFNEGELITAFNNNPNLQNMRNDYSIWGERTSVSGAKIPIHLRYAIDVKPAQYTNYANDKTTSAEECDWREILYQMAVDFMENGKKDDFLAKIAQNNDDLYPTGRTGYEQYYTDILGGWRELYNPAIPNSKDEEDKTKYKEYIKNYYSEGEHLYWSKNVYEAPEKLNFWFDFLDVEGELSQYNVKNIGARPKAVNDTNIKAIYFRETPNVIFVDKQWDEQEESKTGIYRYIQLGDTSMFAISSQGKSAKDKLDELIYQHGYCTESATITTIPIYYLEPNIRITVSDKDTNLHGDYIVSKITLPLAYNGTMSLTATKAAETLL